MEEIYRVVYDAIRKVKPALLETELSPATRFDLYHISSIEMAMIVFEVSDYFDVEVEPYLLMSVATIGEACTALHKIVQQRQPARALSSDV